MLLFGALSGPLPKLGVVAAALLAAAVMLHPDARVQALAMLGALVLSPVLLLGDIWHSQQLSIVHRHPAVAAVSYAGLAGDKYNKLARKYAPRGAGAVFTFSLKGGYQAGVNLVSNLKLFSHLANVGDTRSLVIHPASTTHSQLDDAAKVKAGAGPDIVRLSIGIEDKEDLIADLDQALGT